MLTRKFSSTGARAQVTFQLKLADNVSGASVLGDFNNWTPGAHKMVPRKSGDLTVTISLPTNHRFTFKYLTNEGAWLNDDAADHYTINEWGEANSVVDTAVIESAPAPAKKKTTSKKAAKKATAKKAAKKSVAKKAPAKKAAAKKTAKKTAKKKAPAKKATSKKTAEKKVPKKDVSAKTKGKKK